MKSFQITLLPENRKLKVSENEFLHSALTDAGVHIESTCGGKGTCGKCKVKVVEGTNTLAKDPGKKLSHDDIEAGWRLACLIPVEEDLTIWLPEKAEEGDRKSSLSGQEQYNVVTNISKTHLEVAKPSLDNQASDINRILEKLDLDKPLVSYEVIKKAPEVIRSSKEGVTLTCEGNRMIDIEPGDTTNHIYGIAFDIGTTTVAGSLIDLTNGKVIAAHAEANAQRNYGADVIARITYTSENDGGLQIMKEKAIETLNNITDKLIEKTQINRDNIYSIVTVGNTVMQHLLVGADPVNIALSPYVPVFQNSLRLNAYDMGIKINKEATIYTVPNVSGYVGADTVGVALATHIEESDDILLAVDIGTNGEMILGNKDRMLACSTAAGPAFEGASITYGMRAADGAIERVKLTDTVEIEVIGNTKAIGICGSGLVDAVAELVRVGIVNVSGRLLPPEDLPENLSENLRNRVVPGRNGYDFVLYVDEDSSKNVLLTQKDIRELQLAKGAILAGIKIMIKEYGISTKDISRVLLAGAFGSYIGVEAAKEIALLPTELDVEQVGNAAGTGSRMALASDVEKDRADRIADNIDYIELSSRPDFQDEFMGAMGFNKD